MSEGVGSPSPREYLTGLLSLAPRALRAIWIGGIALAIGLGGTVAWTLSTAHLYRSEAVIAFDHGVRTATIGAAEHDSPREIGARLRDTMMSRQRLEKVIQDLNLYRRIADRQGTGAAIEEMRKNLAISGREEYAYRVSYDANGRELAQHVLETLIKGVIDEDIQQRAHEAEETKRFLDVERRHADQDLKSREAALSTFLHDNPRLAGEAGGEAATAGALIRAADRDSAPGVSGQIAALELQAAQYEESLAAAGVRVPAQAGGPPPGDPALLAARARVQADLQAAQRELIEKESRFTNEHPDVKAALRRVAAAESAVRLAEAAVEADRASNLAHAATAPAAGGEDEASLTSRTAALKHALSAVRDQINDLRSRGGGRVAIPHTVGTTVAIDADWTRLNRAVSEARERLTQLEGKQFQADLMATLAAGGQGGRLVVIDPPFRPVRPITGGRFKIAGVGLAASIVLSLLTILLFAALDDRLYGEQDVHRIVKDGIVVVVPKLTGKSG